MNNFNNVVNNNQINNFQNQNNYSEQEKNINNISSKDDFNFLTFRGSIYHDFINEPNFQVFDAREESYIAKGDIFHYNIKNQMNYNHPNQNIFNNNMNNYNRYMTHTFLNQNSNKANNQINYDLNNNVNNHDIRQRKTRAFSQKNHNNSNIMLNKYNFNKRNLYNQNLTNNNINIINNEYYNSNQIKGQNNLRINDLRINQNDKYKSSFPSNIKIQNKIQYPTNISNIELQNKVKNYEINQIDKYLRNIDFNKTKIESNINVDTYNKSKLNNNLINNININKNDNLNNINLDYQVSNKEGIIIEPKINEVKNISDFIVKSDTTIIINNESNNNNDINNNNSNNEKIIEDSDVKINPVTLSKFVNQEKDKVFLLKTINSGSINNNSEKNKKVEDNNKINNNNNLAKRNEKDSEIVQSNSLNIIKNEESNTKIKNESNEDNLNSLNSYKNSNISHENYSLSEANELNQDLSYISEEELPNEIHNHSFKKKLLNNDLCIICEERKYFVKGYKCSTCSFILCDICTSLIISGYYSNDKHRHPLVLLEKEKKTKCNLCNININNFCFHCEECNFTNCINCYIPNITEKIREKKKEEEKEKQTLIHEHNLVFLEILKCIICQQDDNRGYSCKLCDFKICFICLNKLFYKIKSCKFHKHQMKIMIKLDAICEKCNCDLISETSLYCNECQQSFCLKCFNKN